MALTVATEVGQAALNAIGVTLNNGQFRLTDTAGGAGAEIANLTLPATPFQNATNASPSVATSGTITSDTSITPSTTILGFSLRTTGAAARISGNVATTGSDLNVTDNVVPADATEITCTGGLTLTLTMS